MIATWVERTITRQERGFGQSMNYLRDVAGSSIGAFFKYAMFIPMSRHRKAATPETSAVAWVAAMQQEDCGPCLQIAVDLALAAKVDRAVIRAALAGGEALPEPLGEVYRYARAVASGSAEANALSDALREKLGRDVLVDLALGIASARVFPTLKRALGHARSCSLVRVEVD